MLEYSERTSDAEKAAGQPASSLLPATSNLPSSEPERWMTIGEVEAYCGISRSAVLGANRVLLPTKLDGERRYRRETVERWHAGRLRAAEARRETAQQQQVAARSVERAARRAAAQVGREDERQRRMSQQRAKQASKLKDRDGDLVFAPAYVDRLGRELGEGDLLYTEPCALDPTDPLWYDAQRGAAPRWPELVEHLAARGLDLRIEAPYYWRVVDVDAPPVAPPERLPTRGVWRAGTTSSDAKTLRFRGSGKRGVRPSSEIDGLDLRQAIRELERGTTELLDAHGMMPGRERRAAIHAALARIALATRFADQVVERRGGICGDATGDGS